ENLLEHGLQTGFSPLGRGDVLLQKVFVGFALNLDEVGRLNNFFDVSEVTAISHSRLSVDGIDANLGGWRFAGFGAGNLPLGTALAEL
ncbi:MAG: hypothetical protein VYC95_04220, partial [Verrucomicrobiota bacterium]|nr:hypothetical protein [Verrucomicrobiota bacterium]